MDAATEQVDGASEQVHGVKWSFGRTWKNKRITDHDFPPPLKIRVGK